MHVTNVAQLRGGCVDTQLVHYNPRRKAVVKKNYPLSGKEAHLDADTRLISTTDLKGIITYANDDFMRVSGFSAEEVLRASHNIVRHPDMPPAAFADLWATLKDGKPWMGIVNNRCKNGDNYWVDAYVTPIHAGDRVVGYQSVRSKPDAEQVRRAKAFYQGINQGVPLWRRALALLTPGSTGKLVLSHVATLAAFVAAVVALGQGAVATAVAGLVALGVAVGGSHLITRPWKRAARTHRAVFANAISQQVYTGRDDELGQLQLVIQALQAQLRTVLGRIGDAAEQLQDVAHQTQAIVDETHAGVERQQDEITHVATAMHEMSATVQEIARNASHTAEATRAADHEAHSGIGKVNQVIGAIEALASDVHQTSESVRRLAEDSSQIGAVVGVIRSIAEQTNLLALNAAIEAARAGESGRGFAVVAEEVRNLATRTQESTREIQNVVERLQAAAESAAEAMERNESGALSTNESANSAGRSLSSITDAITRISDMSTQIATASEEQSSVAEEINRNIVSINQISEHTAAASRETHTSSRELGVVVEQMRSMLRQFGAV